jgi:hypothetical protein
MAIPGLSLLSASSELFVIFNADPWFSTFCDSLCKKHAEWGWQVIFSCDRAPSLPVSPVFSTIDAHPTHLRPELTNAHQRIATHRI